MFILFENIIDSNLKIRVRFYNIENNYFYQKNSINSH